MKKVIEGKLYNTETAKKIGYYSNGMQRTDFYFFEETLYKTKSGQYFVYGSGGGNSKYGEWHGNSGGPGEEIRAYTEAEAKEWCEQNLSGDEYISIWGNPEGENTKTYEVKYLQGAEHATIFVYENNKSINRKFFHREDYESNSEFTKAIKAHESELISQGVEPTADYKERERNIKGTAKMMSDSM